MQPYLQYIVLFGAVVIVGAMVMPRKKKDVESSPQSMQNMETALEQFMENMEKDNEELVLLVRKAQQESKIDAQQKEQRISELERTCEQLTVKLREALTSTTIMNSQTASYQQSSSVSPSNSESIIIEEKDEQRPEETLRTDTIHARYSELFLLYEQGKSIEMISKKLGMNKGEVQLIIQLAKQEVAAHA